MSAPRATRAIASATSTAVAMDRGHEEHDHGVDARVGQQRRQYGLVRRCGRGAQQVDRIRDARLDGDHAAKRLRRLVGERGQLEAGAVARVGAENSEAAGVRDDRDTVAEGERLRREQHRGVEQLLERVGTQHAGLPEERVDGLVRACKGGCVRARCARSGAARAAAQREDRLRARDAPGDPGELLRVPERLEVEQDQVGLVVLLPVLEQVVRRDVGLVADRHEARKPETAGVGLLEERQAERTALRREGDPPRRQRATRKRRVQARHRRGDAQAVGADEPRTVRAHECQ